MTMSMKLWSIDNDRSLKPILTTKLNLEAQLEDWIANDPTILDLDLMVLGRQIRTYYGGVIDILALNREGDTVIIELKRDKTPRDIVAQCIDYASWVNDLTENEILEIHKSYTGKSLEAAYQTVFEDQLPESLNEKHQIVIVAASLDDATERIIEYLSEKHSVNINAVFFNIFEFDGKQILGRSWLKDPEVIEEESSKGRNPWTGYLFVNTGIAEGRVRDWKSNLQYSYVSAGGSSRCINAIRKLKPGDKIFAYIKNSGYVGYGLVEAEAVPVSEYEVNGKHMVDDLPRNHPWKTETVTTETGEWLAKVKWIKTFLREQAKWLTNGFANQNVVCKLRDRRTFDFLMKEFDVIQDGG
ncbi:MAG TPA: DUF91 domain-containing protein [Proteobacteria bacterium]|nr:DUF91 domain-containing protein [Pseudomonadota bacterium]